MANIIETGMWVASNPAENNNKFWKFEKYDDGTVKYTWGRVGADNPQSKTQSFDEKKHNATIREKEADKPGKRYEKRNIIGNSEGTSIVKVGASAGMSKDAIAKLAAEEIGAGDPVVAKLVTKLAIANRHELQLASGGELDIDLATGIVRTALGVVELDAVKKARGILTTMAPFVTKHDTENSTFVDMLGAYLRLVPQKVPHARGWYKDFIGGKEDLNKQTSLLDQLETSIELATKRVSDAEASTPAEKRARAFEVTMKIVEDAKIISWVHKLYRDTAQSRHTSYRLKPVRVYEICIPHMASAFEADGRKVGGIKTLWHGTRMFNVLSIMKRGLVLPKTLSTMQLAGAMFGNGLYFSDQSTKSLNYAHGYWDGGAKDSTCYMFLADVAMGREYIPSGPCNGQKPGYDSCHAIGGKSGVMNDEQIVYRTSQANLRYLIEFSE